MHWVLDSSPTWVTECGFTTLELKTDSRRNVMNKHINLRLYRLQSYTTGDITFPFLVETGLLLKASQTSLRLNPFTLSRPRTTKIKTEPSAKCEMCYKEIKLCSRTFWAYQLSMKRIKTANFVRTGTVYFHQCSVPAQNLLMSRIGHQEFGKAKSGNDANQR